MSFGRKSFGPSSHAGLQSTSPLARSGSIRKAETFSFPMLKTPEILACLAEVNLEVDETLMSAPKPDQIRHVYEVLACECLDLTMEELYQPKFEGLDALKNPELHDDSVPVLHFVRAMDKLLLACGVSDGLNLTDLVKPDPRRVRRNLSAIINFHKFREERLAVYAQYSEKGETLLTRRNALEQEKAALEEQLAQLIEVRSQEEPELDAIRKECEQLGQSIGELNQRQAKLRATTNDLKKEANDLRSHTQATAFETESKQEELDQLHTQIVENPQAEKQSVYSHENAVEKARKELSDVEKQKKLGEDQIATIDQAISDIQSATTLLQEVESSYSEWQKLQTKAGGLSTQYDDISARMAETEVMLQTIREHRDKCEAKLSEMRSSMNVKDRAAERAAASGRRELQELQQASEAAMEKRRRAEEQLDTIQKDTKNEQEAHDVHMQQLMMRWRQIRQEVESFHRKLFTAMEQTQTNVQQLWKTQDA